MPMCIAACGMAVVIQHHDFSDTDIMKLLFILVILFVVGCEPQVNNRILIVTLGDTQLIIPAKYFLPELPPTLVPRKGLDKDEGALLRIPLHELGYEVKENMKFRYDLILLMTPLSSHFTTSHLPPTVRQAWLGLGRYKNRIIEFDNINQLYRVYDDEYRTVWQFFQSYPDPLINPSEKWIAGCLKGPLDKEAPDSSNISCNTTFLYKDIYIEMSFSGKHIGLVKKFELKIRNFLNSWEFNKLT